MNSNSSIFFQNIRNINSENEAISFIMKRFSIKKYRGMHLSQHNRYNETKLYGILECIKKVFTENNLEYVEIPPGDEYNGKNNGFFLSDYPYFEKIVNLVKNYGLRGTANTLKKNFFPDLEKSGLVVRFDKKTRFKLNEYIMKTNREEWVKKELYKIHINELLPKDFSKNIYLILLEFESLSLYEFLLFFTFINDLNEIDKNLSNQNNVNYIKNLIRSWRNLSKINQKAIIENLKHYMDPSLYKNMTKDKKKDWGNFTNETKQIFTLLKESNLFQIIKNSNNIEEITLKKRELFDKAKYRRNYVIYNEYHQKNKTKSEKGFEMDHIVRFSLITNPEDVPYIDNYLNILYIDGKSHSIKTQKGSNHMILKRDDNSKNILTLEDFRNIEKPIILKIDENVKIKEENIDDYIKHNKRLLFRYALEK